MSDLWYAIVVAAIALYAVLDGFDLGAGALHLQLAREPRERRQLLAAIGPWWDANEVWLLAAGGALFTAFPRALASGLSGFYFAIFLVLWGLIGRGIAIEMRHQIEHPLWTAFWDVAFAGSSLLLAICFGAALGNLIRGVPLDAQGWFALPLFTNFSTRPPIGILDVYTIAAAGFAALVLCAHGATFLAWRCDGGVETRAAALARRLWFWVALVWLPLTAATAMVNAPMLRACLSRPAGMVAVAVALAGIVAVLVNVRRGPRVGALGFAGSCAFLLGLLAATAAGLHPALLRSAGDPALSITTHNAAASEAGLRAALGWWSLGSPLVALYFGMIARLHRRRVAAE